MAKVTNEQFLIQVKADIKQALAELKTFTGEVNKTGEAGKKSSTGIAGMGVSMGTMVAAAGAYVTLNLATKLLQEADSWNVLQARIKTATRETGDYNTVSAELYKTNQRNGQQMETTVSLFQALARTAPELGATNQEMLALTNTVQQLGVISGTTQAAQRAGLLQFTQGLAGGVFRAEEFNSVLENLPELANRIAKGMGLTVGQLRSAVLEGKVLSQDVFDAIQSQADEINTQFNEMPNSLARSSDRLSTSFTHFLGQLDQALGVTQAIAAGMDGISESLDKLSTSKQSDLGLPTQDEIQAQVKALEEQIKLLEQRNILIQQTANEDRSFQQQSELSKNLRDIAILKQELLDLDDSAIEAVEQQNAAIYARSDAIKKANAEYRAMLDEQWNSNDDKAWSAEQKQQLDDYNKSMQEFIDRLDPAGAATRQLYIDLDRLNKLFFDEGAISSDRYDQLTAALLGSADAASQAAAEFDAMDRALDLIDDQFAALDEAEARQIAGLDNMGKSADKNFDHMTAAIRGWGNEFTNTLVEMTMTGEISFKKMADSIIRDLLRIAIQTQITQPLINAIFPGTFPTSTTAPTNHNGGIVGQSGSSMQVNPAVFNGAPRYHSGGIAGLKPNEVPSILLRNEEVLTTDDPRHSFNMRGGGGTVRVEVHNENTPIEATRSDVSFDADAMVISVFTRDIKNGGQIDGVLRSTYKLNR